MSTTFTFILGAPDPEMAAIEGLLRQAGVEYLYAACGGRRVSPRDAYEADGWTSPAGGVLGPAIDGDVIVVECGGPVLGGLTVVARCDHHRPGDPGYGRPPGEFLAASSLGQVVAWAAREGLLERMGWSRVTYGTAQVGFRLDPWPVEEGGRGMPGWGVGGWGSGTVPAYIARALYRVPADLVLTAAADHCLAAAFAGRCPGVDPEELLRQRAAERGAWLARGPGQGRDEARRAVARDSRFVARRARFASIGDVCAAVDSAGSGDTRAYADPSRSAGAGELTSGVVWAWTEAVSAAIESTRALLRVGDCPIVQLRLDHDPAGEVLDLREVGALAELPTAAALEGVAVLYRMVPPPGSRDPRAKVGIMGAGAGSLPGTAPIEAFLGGWATAAGLVDLYPDPTEGRAAGVTGPPTVDELRAAAARGYCGGYEECQGSD